LQSKSDFFQIEKMLKRTNIVQLNLTEDEVTEPLEEFLKNPSSDKFKDESLKFVDEIVRLSPPLNKEKAKKLQTWSYKYQCFVH
jgi:pantoate kinase